MDHVRDLRIRHAGIEYVPRIAGVLVRFADTGQRPFPVQRYGVQRIGRRHRRGVVLETPQVQRVVGLGVKALHAHLGNRLIGRELPSVVRDGGHDWRVRRGRSRKLAVEEHVLGLGRPIAAFYRFDHGRRVLVEQVHLLRMVQPHDQQLDVVVLDFSVRMVPQCRQPRRVFRNDCRQTFFFFPIKNTINTLSVSINVTVLLVWVCVRFSDRNKMNIEG